MKTYWTAHCRGCDFKKLKKEGFIVLYPKIDDYVFLEALDTNKGVIRRESGLNIQFIKSSGSLALVTEDEIKALLKAVKEPIEVGSKVSIIDGTYSNLEGIVTEIKGNSYFCEVLIFKRTIIAKINKSEVVLKGLNNEPVGC